MTGKDIAHYRITAKLGEGGMGAVYRATDTKLNREVAVKVLPDGFASNPERLARFTREAQVLASLNHPNIAAIYGVEDRALIMELVEGEAPCGPLPVDEALALARQLAEALEYAHEKGIVHRDLKPANIKVTSEGQLKVLDFGLAKAMDDSPSADIGNSPTMSIAATKAGVILGSAGYMSPEQARGKPVDKRADIWAFGVVLFELLSGTRGFDGDTVSDSLAAILTKEPDWAALPAGSPERLLRRCLQKDPKQRLRDIGDARLQILEGEPAPTASAPASKPAPKGLPLWVTGAGVVVGVALGASLLLWCKPEKVFWKIPAAAPRRVLRQGGTVSQAALSPDGNQFVYVFERELYLQALAGGEPRRLTSDGYQKYVPRFSFGGDRLLYARYSKDETASALFSLDLPQGLPRLMVEDANKGAWSPDGRRLAFIRLSSKEAFVGDAEGKEPRSLGPASTFGWTPGLAWSPDGETIALIHRSRIHLVTPDGKSRRELPGVGAAEAVFTPDGRFLLVQMGYASYWCIWQVSVRGGAAVPFATVPYEANNPTLSHDGQKLMAIFHKDEMHVLLAESATRGESSWRQISFGEGETHPALAPDEKKIAYVDWSRTGGIQIVNVNGSEPRVIPATNYVADLAWAPDGTGLIYSGRDDLWTVRLDEGNPRRLATVTGLKHYPSYTADGRSVVFQLIIKDGKDEIWQAPVNGGQARTVVTSGYFPRASPVGTQVAYFQQPAPDHWELHVLNTSNGEDHVAVTAASLMPYQPYTCPPRWSRDGRYLYLLTATAVVRVPAAGGALEKTAFILPKFTSSSGFAPYFDIFSDGRRLLFGDIKATDQPWLYSDLH